MRDGVPARSEGLIGRHLAAASMRVLLARWPHDYPDSRDGGPASRCHAGRDRTLVQPQDDREFAELAWLRAGMRLENGAPARAPFANRLRRRR